MIAFDTNYVVRHLVQDDPSQCKIVAATIAAEVEGGRRILLHDLVLCEVLWVLESVYAATRSDLLTALKSLAAEAAFAFENPGRVNTAIESFERGQADFSDYILLGLCRGAGNEFHTFDKKLKKAI